MGSQQSKVDRVLENNVVFSNTQRYISQLATNTNAVSNNVQNLKLNVRARESGPINISQRISSFIDVKQMVSNEETSQMSRGLQESVKADLSATVDRVTDGISNLIPSAQITQVSNRVKNQLNTQVEQIVSSENVIGMLINSNNVQDGVVNLDIDRIEGPINFTQQLQSSIMADNFVNNVIDSIQVSEDMINLANLDNYAERLENINPINRAITDVTRTINLTTSSLAYYIGGVVALVIGIILSFLVKGWWKLIIIALGIIIAVALIIIGYRSSRPKIVPPANPLVQG